MNLTGDYVELRLLPEAHIPTLLKIYQGTPLYFDGLGDRADRLTQAAVQAQWRAAQAEGRTLLGVYHIETDLLIGAADVRLETPEPGAAALWLLIWGGFQRQGYGQECMALLEQWLAETHGAVTLYAIAAANEEGQSFLRLQGFGPTDTPAQPVIGQGHAHWMRRPAP